MLNFPVLEYISFPGNSWNLNKKTLSRLASSPSLKAIRVRRIGKSFLPWLPFVLEEVDPRVKELLYVGVGKE